MEFLFQRGEILERSPRRDPCSVGEVGIAAVAATVQTRQGSHQPCSVDVNFGKMQSSRPDLLTKTTSPMHPEKRAH